MSTTSVLSAVPEIVKEYETTANAVSISNALYLLFMALSSCLWGPASDFFGRRKVYLSTIILFSCFSLGTSLAPNLAAFCVFRALTATQGIAPLILGSSCISDIYHPIERATALAWFLVGSMSGYAFGPIIGGVIVTYATWRAIFWLQTALSAASAVVIYFLLSETIHETRTSELHGKGLYATVRKLGVLVNPWKVVQLYRQRNLAFVMLASSALVWNMYTLLTPVRYVLNPRLNLTSPLQSGMLFFAPGTGYLVGVQAGGRWADFQVRRWAKFRGYRRPEDRLRSCLFALGVVLPGSMLIYGWLIDKRIGGISVPVVCMFFQGVAQMATFVSLNAYILDVMQSHAGKASAAHYLMRFVVAAIGTGVCLPSINHLGIGWTSSISSAFLFITAVLVYWTVRSGEAWRGVHSLAAS